MLASYRLKLKLFEGGSHKLKRSDDAPSPSPQQLEGAREFYNEVREYQRRKKHTEQRDKRQAAPHAQSVTRRDDDDDDDSDEEQCPCTKDNPLLHPIRAGARCFLESVSNFFHGKEGHCWDKLENCADCYEDVGDYLGHLLDEHLVEAEVEIKVVEDIELAMQVEVEVPLSVSCSGTFDYYPPDVLITSFAVSGNIAGGPPGIFSHPGWTVNGDAAQKISDQYNEKGELYPYYHKQKPKEGDGKFGMGTRMIAAPPLSLQIGITANGGANITLPGLSVKLPAGDFFKMDLLADDKLQHNLHPKVEYRDAKVVLTQDPSLDISIQLGPRVSINLISYNGDSKLVKTIIGRPFDLGARVDLVRLDLILKEANNVDKNCMPKGHTGIASALSFETIVRQGMSAWFQFGPFRWDTSNIGKLDKGDVAIPGLYVSKSLYKHCIDTGFVKAFKDVSNNLVESVCDVANEIGRKAAEELNDWFAEHPGKAEPINVTTTWDRDRRLQQAQIDACMIGMDSSGPRDEL
ncbi:hypothetical protein LTR56_017639 [Elasticomyces elasticus]|nr:hypothetical protein LTR56_017639 [Elasticomyces elasticus]KAK3638585.1 hypothetical protein LTR22_017769 [Elasticomyces elasticus]KAK4913035.1 hypothetical protein LTR49_018593 [Elasticomyces elasticus]KAK5757595.1 hypothetical protein LTS12_012301 [Elasticomyces elasticus]